MTKETVTRWFVEPLNTKTNKNAFADVMKYSGGTEDKIHHRKKDDMGLAHDVLEVERWFILRLEGSVEEFDHRFRVFTQVGEGTMRFWPFGNQKKIQRTKEVKRMAEEISEIKKKRQFDPK